MRMRAVLSLGGAAVVFLAVGCAAPPAAQPAAAPQQPQAAPQAKPASPAQQAPQPAPAQAAKPAPAKPAAPAPAEAAQRLFLGGNPATSTYYAYHVAEARYLNQKVPKVSFTVMETRGGIDNITRLSGELAVAGTGADAVYQVYHGVGAYKDKKQPDLRYLWMYTLGSRVVLVRDESGVKTLADLTGKDFNPGPKGTSSEVAFKAHADLLGIKPRYYTASGPDAFQAIKDRRIVGMNNPQAGLGADALTLDLMISTKIRAIGYSDDEVKRIQAERPWDPFVTLKKDEWAKGAEGFTTMASVVGDLTTKQNLTEGLAYELSKALMEPAAVEQISAGIPWLKGWDYRKKTLESASIPLHAGVLKYLREVGEKVPDRLVPPEAK